MNVSFATTFSECNRVVLPDDAGQLKALIAQRDATIETLSAALESLKQQFLSFRRAQFGASSERIAGQGELFIEPVSLPVPPVQRDTIPLRAQPTRAPGAAEEPAADSH